VSCARKPTTIKHTVPTLYHLPGTDQPGHMAKRGGARAIDMRKDLPFTLVRTGSIYHLFIGDAYAWTFIADQLNDAFNLRRNIPNHVRESIVDAMAL